MADLKSVTMEYLRELARKHLGRGHSKLKTKKDLLSALARLVPGLARLAGEEEPGKEKPQKAAGALNAPVARSAASRSEKPEEPGPRQRLPEPDDENTPVYPIPRPAEVVSFPPRSRPAHPQPDEEPTLPVPPPATAPVEPPAPAPVQHAAEPLVEGFFVARMAGEAELWRHHLTESQARPPREALGSPDYEERLGELPDDYGDDTLLLLPRDPHTLFLLWDFSPAARARSLAGLESPRAVLRVYDGDSLVRVVDVALESRGFHLHGLTAGQPYRVEAHFVGRDGRSRRIGPSSNRVFLPPAGPASDTSVRFLRMPPLAVSAMESVAATAPTRTASFEEREYLTWRRVALPGSAGFQDLPERRRERLEQEAPPSPGGAPGEGAPSLPYLEVRRAEGSSEQQAWARPLGGASEQYAWTPSPSGRGR